MVLEEVVNNPLRQTFSLRGKVVAGAIVEERTGLPGILKDTVTLHCNFPINLFRLSKTQLIKKAVDGGAAGDYSVFLP